MPEAVHLVKIPVRPDRLVALARRRRLATRELDDGYVAHCFVRELWQDLAPHPFVLKPSGRTLELWGYSAADASSLVEHARDFGDPELISIIDDLNRIAAKEMPVLPAGRRVGFVLRACPVVRVGRGATTHRPGSEVDAFLVRCTAVGPEADVSREHVYLDWLKARFGPEDVVGAVLATAHIVSLSRTRLMRRTQGNERRAASLQRPEVWFEGELIINDGNVFRRWLRHGIGRHRAFGFGALMLQPPGAAARS